MTDQTITLTSAAFARIEEMRENKGSSQLRLRIAVEGGGCSGFQYIFSWDNTQAEGDQVFDDAIITDSVSLPFLLGSTLDYTTNLMGEKFHITNPNASSGCSCGSSFGM
ncbi:MAG: iron-sulfur cluster assembly accessory protein [Alphaproteobacteria bacterium]|jgi:iron-sulfur cluster insertion protein|nr:iron-sulfur cluster assembly accessory protein [Alphaproteobacteria bacterium]MBP9868485.1 iron-sulfur cluster assembly accessory protein [Alphaproteobacteria bacterium]